MNGAKNDPVLRWRPEYSVGNPEIDRQHQYLFSLLQALEEIKCSSDNRLTTLEALNGLSEYVHIHFSFEEQILSQHPAIAAHRRDHLDFFTKIAAFIRDFEKDTLEASSMVRFLNDWLINHILANDIISFQDLRKTNATSGGERRESSRCALRSTIVFRTATSIVESRLDIRNLSLTGALISLDEPVETRTRCSIEIRGDGGAEDLFLLLEGIVVRREDKGVAVRFRDSGEELQLQLEHLLARHRDF